MPIQVLMPALSPTMTEGNLVKWHKKEGDTVKAGQVIAEIETDKATMEVEAVDEGVLGRILVPAGAEAVQVNTLIALILEEGEDIAVLENFKAEEAPTPKAEQPAETAPAVAASTPATAVTREGGRVFASPLARRLAEQKDIQLHLVEGSGPRGRIIKEDVLKAAETGAGAVRAGSFAHALPAASGAVEVTLSGMRKTIAKRLTESKQQVPHFYLTVDCEIDRLLALRSEINSALESKISVNDFVIRAVALALKKVPAANMSWNNGNALQYLSSDISVAVAIEGGLITPVIRQAEHKSMSIISQEMKSLAEKARAGKLKPEEYAGGSFSISNLGMYGVKEFKAILNPPQGCILAVGAGEQRPVVKDGALAVATVMTCSLSVDHRIVDGAVGAEFLAAFKKFIQEPVLMLV